MNELELTQFLEDLNLIGQHEIIRFNEEAPIIFLIDENHDNLNNNIQSNIENTIKLLDNADVVLIGVESSAGGKAWDYKQNRYNENYADYKFDRDLFISKYTSKCTTFSNSVVKHEKANVIGVECWGMMHKISKDLTEEDSQYYGINVSDHPLHFYRSKHFVQTLWEEYDNQELIGNLILNCGRDHNSDIVELIRATEQYAPVERTATYVRINTIEQ